MGTDYREELLLLISTPLYVVIIGIEMLLSHIHHWNLYSKKEVFTNIWLTSINMALDIAMRSISIFYLVWASNHAVFHTSEPKNALYWIGLAIGIDFMYYWLHRTDHYCRLFWAVHVTHHSSEEFNFTTGFRSSVFEPLYRFIFYLPLAFVGFNVSDIIFMHSALQIYGVLVHTNRFKKGTFGFLEQILVMPTHHRVHHGSNILYLDKNMGMTLIIWDKLFGTFQEELEEEPVKYGLTTNVADKNPINIIFHEWKCIAQDLIRKDITFKQKLAYLLMPPGWSHDGSRKTSEELRKKS